MFPTLQSAFGLIALLVIAWAASENRRTVPWRIVIPGVILQLLLALLLLKAPPLIVSGTLATLATGAIRYVQFDATRHAGFTEALRVAQFAEQHGVQIAPHHAPELHAHLVAAFPRCGFCVESHGAPERDPIWFGLFKERAQVRESHVHLNDKPGFGIEINWDFVEAHRAR